MPTAQATAMIGHNNPPANTPEDLRDELQHRHAALLEKATDLLNAGSRVPETVADDNEAAKITVFIKQIANAAKGLEAARVDEKQPYLNLGRAVDGFFGSVKEQLDTLSRKAKRPLDAYLKAKADEERREREARAAEERRQAQEQANAAAALAQLGATAQAESTLQVAAQTEARAVTLEVSARIAAKLARVRADEGSASSLRTRWVGEVTDRAALDLEALRHHLPADALQKALNAYIAAGGRELRGARIEQKSEAVVR